MVRRAIRVAFLGCALICHNASAFSVTYRVSPANADSLGLPMKVTVDTGSEAGPTLSVAFSVSESFPRERLSAYLHLRDGAHEIAWVKVARLDHQRYPLSTFCASVSRDVAENSYLEVQIGDNAIPSADEYQFYLGDWFGVE